MASDKAMTDERWTELGNLRKRHGAWMEDSGNEIFDYAQSLRAVIQEQSATIEGKNGQIIKLLGVVNGHEATIAESSKQYAECLVTLKGVEEALRICNVQRANAEAELRTYREAPREQFTRILANGKTETRTFLLLPPEAETPKPLKQEWLNCDQLRVGMKVVYLDSGGHSYEPEDARKAGLVKGNIYTVTAFHIGSWSSWIRLDGYGTKQFNHVMFGSDPDETPKKDISTRCVNCGRPEETHGNSGSCPHYTPISAVAAPIAEPGKPVKEEEKTSFHPCPYCNRPISVGQTVVVCSNSDCDFGVLMIKDEWNSFVDFVKLPAAPTADRLTESERAYREYNRRLYTQTLNDMLDKLAPNPAPVPTKKRSIQEIAEKILKKLDSPTESVTAFDADELRAALAAERKDNM